jgi:hypothetical protein
MPYRKGVNHSLESKVDLACADDLCHILKSLSACHSASGDHPTHTWVIWFKQGNLDAFICEETLGLSQVKRSVVWHGMPGPH